MGSPLARGTTLSDPTHVYSLRVVPHAGRLDGELLLPAGEHLLETATWVPGAYAYLRYGRDLVDVRAEAASTGAPLGVQREGWTGYRIEPCAQPIRVTFRAVMADPAWGELAGYVTSEHAVLHPTRLPHVRSLAGSVRVHYELPEGWAMHHPAGAARENESSFLYPSFADWLDTPVVAGAFVHRQRQEGSTTFHYVFLEQAVGLDTELEGFLDDVQKIARAAGDVFSGFPFAEYTFVCSFDSRAHWGLEHAHATLVGLGPLALVDDAARFDALRVIAHELVHAWNVCRLKPAAFAPADLVAGGLPGELWIAEGFTRYYEFLLLVRAGFCTPERFFSNVVSYHDASTTRPGYARTSLLDSARATFLNHHRYPNAANTMIDYYDVGMLVAFDLDAELQLRGRSLDEAFATLYRRFGTATGGFTHEDACAVFAELGCEEIVRREVETPGALTTLAQLRRLGFECGVCEASTLGVILDGPRIVHVLEGSGAEAAGLLPDDRIVTHDALAFTSKGLEWLVGHRRSIALVVQRGDRLLSVDAGIGTRPQVTSLTFRGGAEAQATLQRWLGLGLATGAEIALRFYDNFHGTDRPV